jgi:hypothetical protein
MIHLKIISNNRRLLNDYPMALVLSSLYDQEYTIDKTFKSITDIPFVYIDNLKKVISKVYNVSSLEGNKFMPLYSILVWDEDQKEEEHYFTSLPTNFKELSDFFNLRGINIIAILSALKIAKIPIRVILPIIHAIKRPYKVIGYNGNYEFFTYLLVIPDNYPEGLVDETEIYISSHSEPFSSDMASVLSNEKRDMKTLYIGAGSLGSKMLMHDARIGKKCIGVVDNDNFQQHNLGRHSLYANKIGKNKSESMIEEVKAFYELDSTNGLKFYNKLISEVEDKEIEEYSLLVDSTANRQVLHYLISKELKENSIYSKCELVDNGEIGLLYVEGKDRNPRMDDLVNYTYYLGTKNSELEMWRFNDAKREPDTLNIGLGCNSITTVMPDDLISFHASTFSQILSLNPMEKFNGKGLLYLNISRRTNGFPKISNEYILVEPFEIFECQNNSGWSLRLLSGLSNTLLKLCKQYGRHETGGVLVGVANYKTKVIHVFDIIEQPIDSDGTPVAFTRGIVGLPKQIDDIKLQTGEVIGYIGEWHTHPMNLEKLSVTDLKTIEKLKEINKKTPIPTCAIIVTQKKIIPFVYN